MHQTLRESVRRLSPANLQHKLKGSTVTVEFLVTGAAAHDLYHAGQIQLLKKMSAKKVRGSRVGRRISHLL
jgi:cytochrome bd-type quinol oxidase subunit 1